MKKRSYKWLPSPQTNITKALWFILLLVESLLSLLDWFGYSFCGLDDCRPCGLSPFTKLCQWNYPHYCRFIVIYLSFQQRCSTIIPLAQLLSFTCLGCWFIPWQTELCKVNTPMSCSNCSRWTAVHFTTFASVFARYCANSSLEFASPQRDRTEISEVASCDPLLRQHGTLNHFQLTVV